LDGSASSFPLPELWISVRRRRRRSRERPIAFTRLRQRWMLAASRQFVFAASAVLYAAFKGDTFLQGGP